MMGLKDRSRVKQKPRDTGNQGNTRLNFIREGLSLISRSATIRVKLIVSFLIPIVFIIFLGVMSFSKAAEGIRSSYEHSTKQAINMTGDYLQFGAEEVEALSTQYVNEDSVERYFSGSYDVIESDNYYKVTKNSIIGKEATDQFISQIFILSDEIRSIVTTAPAQEAFCEGFYATDLGKSIRNTAKLVWVGKDSYLDEKLGIGSDQYAMRVIRCVAGDDALFIADMDITTIQGILANMEFDNTGIISFVTPDGKEILPDGINHSDALFTDQECYQKAQASEEENGAFYTEYRGKSNLFMYSKVGDTGAMICAVVPKGTILSKADSIRQITVAIVILACIIAVLIGFFISFGIDRVIRNIISKLKIAAEGDLTVDFNTKRKDEFRILSDEISNTFGNMKELVGQVKTLSTDVSEASVNVTRTSEEFVKTTGDISRAMNEIEEGIMQQAKDAEECLQQMDNLSNKITGMSENTAEIAKIAKAARKSIQGGTVTTEILNEQSDSSKKITSDIVRGIEDLAEKSKSIDSIINVIIDISNQTNLLSLNASIEASRAGEYGKGFAVVAGEIRNLADQTKQSVNEIKAIVKSIQDNTKYVVGTAKKAEDVMEQQDIAVKNTTESYLDINQNVDSLMVHLENIIDNVNNMEEARVSTLGAIENISAVLEEIAASTNNVNQISGNQLASVDNLNQSAGSLKSNSNQLVHAIQRFTV